MIYVISKDYYFSQGITELQKNEDILRVDGLHRINLDKINHATKIVIDTYHNNILDETSVNILKNIEAARIIIFAPFHISKLKSQSPLLFVSRNEEFAAIRSLIFDEQITYQKPAITLSHNQLKLVNSIINQHKISTITQSLKISEQTLRIQKFNIMLKLRLRRISDIVKLRISPYF